MLLAIVPARGGSQRIPDKNIVDFCGKPLIMHSLSAAREAGIFDDIHVSTDSNKIAQVVTDAGFTIDFMRDLSLADGYTGLIPVLRWVVERYVELGKVVDEICLLYPTAPLITAQDLCDAYTLFKERNRIHPLMSMSSYAVPVEWAMEIDESDIATARYPEMLNIRSQDLKPCVYETGSFMFLTVEQLTDWGKSAELKTLAYKLPKWRAVDIDDEEDLELARVLYQGFFHARN